MNDWKLQAWAVPLRYVLPLVAVSLEYGIDHEFYVYSNNTSLVIDYHPPGVIG